MSQVLHGEERHRITFPRLVCSLPTVGVNSTPLLLARLRTLDDDVGQVEIRKILHDLIGLVQ